MKRLVTVFIFYFLAVNVMVYNSSKFKMHRSEQEGFSNLPGTVDPARTRHSSSTRNNRSYPLLCNTLPSALGPWHSHSSRSIYTSDRTEAPVEAEKGV